MTDRFERLSSVIQEFVLERAWDTDHDAKSLMLALVGEVGEMAAILQWMDAEQIKSVRVEGSEHRLAASHELADVLIYLIELADYLNIDLMGAAMSKIELNRANYPVELSRGNHRKHPGAQDQDDFAV